MTKADRKTDRELKALEAKISNEYFKAWEELSVELDKYTNGWDENVGNRIIHHAGMYERLEKEKEAFFAGWYGDPTTKEAVDKFRAWWAAQEGRQKWFADMRDQMIERLTKTNQIASDYINDATPKAYSRSSNDIAGYANKSAIEQGVAGVSFSLIDEHTVKQLQMGKVQILPFSTEAKAWDSMRKCYVEIDIPVDQRWNKSKLESALLQGILQGETYAKISKRFEAVTNMNRTSAIRNARTAITAAQNAGKQDRYEELEERGCEVTKIWETTLDGRERDAHHEANGQEVPRSEPFNVGGEELMFPGDMNGSPWNIYNCRCTMKTGKIIFHSKLTQEQRERANIRIR